MVRRIPDPHATPDRLRDPAPACKSRSRAEFLITYEEAGSRIESLHWPPGVRRGGDAKIRQMFSDDITLLVS